jgi:hypothetical protein
VDAALVHLLDLIHQLIGALIIASTVSGALLKHGRERRVGPTHLVVLTRTSVEKRALFDLKTPFPHPKTVFEAGRCS